MELNRKAIGERLTHLRELNNLCQDKAAKLIGINPLTLKKYERGEVNRMEAETIFKMAEFYHASADYILGRSDMAEESYKADLKALAKESYEKYIQTSPHTCLVDQYGSSLEPWPYNLLRELYGEALDDILPMVVPIRDDQMAVIDECINSLNEREGICTYLYFRDENSYHAIGELYNVTTERIRQVVAKAVRKLRAPSRLGNDKRLCYPEKFKEIMNESEVLKELTLKKLELAQKIGVEKAEILLLEEKLKKDQDRSGQRVTFLYDMELSVRTFNCVCRAFWREKGPQNITSDDIFKLFEKDVIMEVRNLGKRSCSELASKMAELGYDDDCVTKYILPERSEAV